MINILTVITSFTMGIVSIMLGVFVGCYFAHAKEKRRLEQVKQLAMITRQNNMILVYDNGLEADRVKEMFIDREISRRGRSICERELDELLDNLEQKAIFSYANYRLAGVEDENKRAAFAACENIRQEIGQYVREKYNS